MTTKFKFIAQAQTSLNSRHLCSLPSFLSPLWYLIGILSQQVQIRTSDLSLLPYSVYPSQSIIILYFFLLWPYPTFTHQSRISPSLVNPTITLIQSQSFLTWVIARTSALSPYFFHSTHSLAHSHTDAQVILLNRSMIMLFFCSKLVMVSFLPQSIGLIS